MEQLDQLPRAVRRGMQSVQIILPPQACWTCSATSPHVASLILSNTLDFIAEYDHQDLFYFYRFYHFYNIFCVQCVYCVVFLD